MARAGGSPAPGGGLTRAVAAAQLPVGLGRRSARRPSYRPLYVVINLLAVYP